MDTTTSGATTDDMPPPPSSTDEWEWSCMDWAVDSLFMAADGDHDWMLDEGEFWNVMDSVWVDRSGPLAESLTAEQHAGIAEVFGSQGGQVDYETAAWGFNQLLEDFDVTEEEDKCEILYFMTAQLEGHLPDHGEMVEWIHWAIDDNMDGVLDQDEVADVIAKVAESPEEAEEIQGFFTAAAGEDGLVTAEEAGETVYGIYAEAIEPLAEALDAAQDAYDRVAIPAWFDIAEILEDVTEAGEWDDQDWEAMMDTAASTTDATTTAGTTA